MHICTFVTQLYNAHLDGRVFPIRRPPHCFGPLDATLQYSCAGSPLLLSARSSVQELSLLPGSLWVTPRWIQPTDLSGRVWGFHSPVLEEQLNILVVGQICSETCADLLRMQAVIVDSEVFQFQLEWHCSWSWWGDEDAVKSLQPTETVKIWISIGSYSCFYIGSSEHGITLQRVVSRWCSSHKTCFSSLVWLQQP